MTNNLHDSFTMKLNIISTLINSIEFDGNDAICYLTGEVVYSNSDNYNTLDGTWLLTELKHYIF